MGRVERVLVDEGGVLLPGADVAQGEYVRGDLVEAVYRLCGDSVSVENLPEGFAAGYFGCFETVEVGVEAVNDVSSSTNTRKTHFVFGS